MKRLKPNVFSPKADYAKSGQKNPRKKASMRTVWLAPSLGVASAAVLLILFSIAEPSHSQTISDTQITLSCNDGHSVTPAVDPATLLQLTSPVPPLTANPPPLTSTP